MIEPTEASVRAEVRAWLDAILTGEFAGLRGAGGPGREHERHDERLAWNRHLAAAFEPRRHLKILRAQVFGIE